jgi:hypothetical protein
MKTLLNVARYHLVERITYVALPWGTTAFAFLVNLAIAAQVPSDVDGYYTGGLLSIYVFLLVCGALSMTRSLARIRAVLQFRDGVVADWAAGGRHRRNGGRRIHHATASHDLTRDPETTARPTLILDLLPWSDDMSKIISKPEQCQQRYWAMVKKSARYRFSLSRSGSLRSTRYLRITDFPDPRSCSVFFAARKLGCMKCAASVLSSRQRSTTTMRSSSTVSAVKA